MGTPRSRHSTAEGPVLGRLPHISLPKCVQSGQTPIRRRAPLVARVDSTWCRARRIAVRSVASSESTARTRTSNGSRASAFLPLLVSRRLTLRPSVLNGCRTKYPPASSALMAFVAVPRGVALNFAKCGGVPREWVATREDPEPHPLGRTEFAVIALSLYEPSHLQQELCRFAR